MRTQKLPKAALKPGRAGATVGAAGAVRTQKLPKAALKLLSFLVFEFLSFVRTQKLPKAALKPSVASVASVASA